jgi:hypothetical protein
MTFKKKTPGVVAKVAPEVVVPVVVFPNVVVYDTEDGNAVKVVTSREARNPRYKTV